MAIHPIESEYYSFPDTTNLDFDTGNLQADSSGRIQFSELTHEAGLEGPVFRLRVSDGYEDAPGRYEVNQQLKSLEQFLRANPEVALNDDDNKAREWIYSTPASRGWKELIPSAAALYPLQRPETQVLPNGAPVDEHSRGMFMHCPDAIGIRTRANVMRMLTKRFTREFAVNNDRPLRWLSIACGAAVPVLDAVRDIRSGNGGADAPDIEMMLVDRDQSALDFARALAENEGVDLPQESFMNRDIVKGFLASDELIKEIGPDSVDVVDMLGIFEYFPDHVAPQLLRQAHKLVAPGGMIAIANMLDTHPNLHINQRGIGWPLINPRSLREVAVIVRNAGIDEKNMQVFVPEDEVYGVIMLRKPEEDEQGVLVATDITRHVGRTASYLDTLRTA